MNFPEILQNQELIDNAEEHHVAGYLYSRNNIEKFKNIWLKQALVKSLLKEEIESITNKYPRISEKMTLLKGMAIHDQFYSDGERFMSDVDILVDEGELDNVVKCFIDEGFSIVEQKQWMGNFFKCELTKVLHGIDINIELHSQLFYHSKIDLQFVTSEIGRIKRLAPAYEFAHIIGHCGFQHTFQKMYWLIDIYHYFLEDTVDLDELEDICRKMKIYHSLELAKYIMNRYFGLNLPVNKVVAEVDLETILNPNQGSLKYFYIKHRLKDSFLEALKYDFKWILMKIKG